VLQQEGRPQVLLLLLPVVFHLQVLELQHQPQPHPAVHPPQVLLKLNLLHHKINSKVQL
jgi:hypothetical protein